MIGYLDDIAVAGAAIKLSEKELDAYAQWRAAKAAAMAEPAEAVQRAAEAAADAADAIEDAVEAQLADAPVEA